MPLVSDQIKCREAVLLLLDFTAGFSYTVTVGTLLNPELFVCVKFGLLLSVVRRAAVGAPYFTVDSVYCFRYDRCWFVWVCFSTLMGGSSGVARGRCGRRPATWRRHFQSKSCLYFTQRGCLMVWRWD